MTDAGLNDVTEVNLLNQLWGNLGSAEGVFQSDNSEFWCGEGFKGAVERSHGGARGSDDDDFGGGLQIALMDGDKDWRDAGTDHFWRDGGGKNTRMSASSR